MSIHNKMRDELRDKSIFNRAKDLAFDYADQIDEMSAFPQRESVEQLKHFEEPMPVDSTDGAAVLEMLQKFGSEGTAAQIGGRYFGFVNGGAVPAALAVKWLADFWDQNGGLFFTSPLNAKLELVCEAWLKEIFNLPSETVAGFVSGSTAANLCALAAARFRLLEKQGWNVNEQGLNGAPAIRIIAHVQVHSAIKKALAILGFGKANVEWIPADDQGRLQLSALPELGADCLVLIQAGNANTGSFDDFAAICRKANEAGAWVHIDGAFGLWAAAAKSLAHLTKGIELADSWAVDGHKTLNTPYDSGIVLCKDEAALITAMQATGEYIIHDKDQRDPMMYINEMSKRARAIELWATMKFLGRTGIEELVTQLYTHSKALEAGLRKKGFRILNEVVFNQVLVACENENLTKATLVNIQNSGTCWCGGSTWNKEAVIRVSICSWATTSVDIDKTIEAFEQAYQKAKN